MRDWFVRCAGCGKQYTYRSWGVQSRFAREYCPDCCAFLDEAISKIRTVFVPRWKEEVLQEEAVDKVRRTIQALREKNTDDEGICCKPVESVPSGMKSGDVLIYSNRKYALCKDYEGLEHVFVWQEYDYENGKFGEKPWLVDGNDRTYPLEEPWFVEASDAYLTEIPEPNGGLFFLDYFEKLPDEGYPKDCGDGIWKIWDGVYGSKKFAEEVEEAMQKEVEEYGTENM